MTLSWKTLQRDVQDRVLACLVNAKKRHQHLLASMRTGSQFEKSRQYHEDAVQAFQSAINELRGWQMGGVSQ